MGYCIAAHCLIGPLSKELPCFTSDVEYKALDSGLVRCYTTT